MSRALKEAQEAERTKKYASIQALLVSTGWNEARGIKGLANERWELELAMNTNAKTGEEGFFMNACCFPALNDEMAGGEIGVIVYSNQPVSVPGVQYFAQPKYETITTSDGDVFVNHGQYSIPTGALTVVLQSHPPLGASYITFIIKKFRQIDSISFQSAMLAAIMGGPPTVFTGSVLGVDHAGKQFIMTPAMIEAKRALAISNGGNLFVTSYSAIQGVPNIGGLYASTDTLVEYVMKTRAVLFATLTETLTFSVLFAGAVNRVRQLSVARDRAAEVKLDNSVWNSTNEAPESFNALCASLSVSPNFKDAAAVKSQIGGAVTALQQEYKSVTSKDKDMTGSVNAIVHAINGKNLPALETASQALAAAVGKTRVAMVNHVNKPTADRSKAVTQSPADVSNFAVKSGVANLLAARKARLAAQAAAAETAKRAREQE